MPSIKGTETEKNLMKAFAGESQARNRYTYFASAAKKEGLVQIADIFAETADQEKNMPSVSSAFSKGANWKLPPASRPDSRTDWSAPPRKISKPPRAENTKNGRSSTRLSLQQPRKKVLLPWPWFLKRSLLPKNSMKSATLIC